VQVLLFAHPAQVAKQISVALTIPQAWAGGNPLSLARTLSSAQSKDIGGLPGIDTTHPCESSSAPAALHGPW
jgi:hypothetical protein